MALEQSTPDGLPARPPAHPQAHVSLSASLPPSPSPLPPLPPSHPSLPAPPQFCPEVAPGEGAVKDCLEDNMLMAGFSEDCAQWLGLLRADRSGGRWARAVGRGGRARPPCAPPSAAPQPRHPHPHSRPTTHPPHPTDHFRLDSKIREYCADDMQRLCGVSAIAAELAEPLAGPVTVTEEQLSRCLQDYRWAGGCSVLGACPTPLLSFDLMATGAHLHPHPNLQPRPPPHTHTHHQGRAARRPLPQPRHPPHLPEHGGHPL